MLAALLAVVTMAYTAKGKLITQALYASTSAIAPTVANSVQLTGSTNLVGFIAGSSPQVTISGTSSTRYVYAYDGISFTKLQATTW